MPFGLTNAPATFQRLMDQLFRDLRFNGALVYLDDILVHAATFDEVHEKLRIILERLRRAGLTINREKCLFFPRELKYLGQLIKDGTLIPDPKRVAALQACCRSPESLRIPRLLPNIYSEIRGYAGPAIRITTRTQGAQE